MKTHLLKLADRFWWPVLSGRKTFEIRDDDRGFREGDLVRFRRVDTAEEMGKTFLIKYVIRHDDFPQGVPEGYCAFSIEELTRD